MSPFLHTEDHSHESPLQQYERRVNPAHLCEIPRVKDYMSDAEQVGELMWEPCAVDDGEVDRFLMSTKGFVSPFGGVVREGAMKGMSKEEALQLLRERGYDVEGTVAFMRESDGYWGCLPEMLPYNWTQQDLELFEDAMCVYYKDFRAVQKDMASSGSSKTQKEIIRVYYKWKNSERFQRWRVRFESVASLKISADIQLAKEEVSESDLDSTDSLSPVVKRRSTSTFPNHNTKRRCLSTNLSYDLEDPFLSGVGKIELSFSLEDGLLRPQKLIEEKQSSNTIPITSEGNLEFPRDNQEIVHAMSELSIHDDYDFCSSENSLEPWFSN